MPATLKDVARLGGVSIATASQALNNGPVNEQTRRKVVEVARTLGYRPNALGRSLQGKHARAIGLALPTGSAGILEAVIPRAQRVGYQVLVEFFDPDDPETQEHACDALLGYRVAGLVIGPCQVSRPRLARTLRDHGVAVVCLDQPLPGPALPCFRCECHRAGRLAGLHLGRLKPRCCLALVCEPPNGRQTDLLAGLEEGLRAGGCRQKLQIVSAGPAPAARTEAAANALRRAGRGGAVFAADETLAADVLRAARQAEKNLPDDLALLAGRQGTGEEPGPGDLMLPRLSVVRRCATETAAAATDFLLDRLRCSEDRQSARQGKVHCIQPVLTVRESCGGVPGLYRLDGDDELVRVGDASAATL